MNLIDLEAFVAVVDHGSIVAASAILHLTQSAVTRRIQNLEEVLGVPLLDRQSRPLQPTRAGRETYEFARPVLSSVSDLKSAIIHNGAPTGGFRFGISRSFGDLALLHPINCLRTSYPLLRVQAFAQWSHALVDRLENRTLDAALVLLAEEDKPPASLVGEYLSTEIYSIVAAKSKRLPAKVRLSDIASNAWILNPHGCGSRTMLEAALLRQKLPFTVATEAEGNDLQFTLVSQDIGLAIVLPRIVSASPLRKQLKTIHVEDFSPRMSAWLLHSRHIGRLAPAVQCLKDAMASFLREGKKVR